MTIEADIIAWALERPGWQQDVLVDLADGVPQGPDYIENLVDRILAGVGRSPGEEAKRIRLESPAGDQVRLVALCGVRDVNALVDGQRLGFAAEGLTVVYGDNGSGKSGYARLIKTFVRARHRAQVLPDVFQPGAGQPSGALDFLVAGQPDQTALPGPPSPSLTAVSFYDEHCGDEYLARESTISYQPSALTLLDGLVRVCDEVRAAIKTRVRDNEAKTVDLGLPSDTQAGVFAAGLSSTTTAAAIDEAVTLPTGDVERLGNVLREEARLTSSDPQRERERLQSTAEQFRRLSAHLSNVLSALTEEKTEDRRRLHREAADARVTAAVVAARSFDDEPLKGIGSISWRALWDAARDYSTSEAYHDHEFPVTGHGAVCVLCQQPLDEGARSRLERFEQYMADTTERDAQTAERTYENAVEELRALSVATPAGATALAALEQHDAALAEAVADLVSRAERHREAVLQHLTNGANEPATLTSTTPVERLTSLSDELSAQAAATDVEQFQATLALLRLEKRGLEAHARLAENRERVEQEVDRQRRSATLLAARSAADTNTITQKSSTLTRRYVTERIRDQFIRETERLRLQKVTLQDLGGRKGKLNHQPGLLGAIEGTAASAVLSEGEQTALGLAGFFTEAEFDDSKSALVLDDPVTSLDHVRRAEVAARLAQLARDRQVIVFTHDVAFAGDLSAAAATEEVSLTERTVERRGTDPGVCIDSFPWKAKDFKARVDYLRSELDKLTEERPQLVQDDWEDRVARWAGYLSETWERSVITEVVNQVFDRGSSQVRVMKFRALSKITDEDDKDLQTGYGRTSLWGRRHDKAPETNYVAPEPADLEKELERIVAWQKRVKKYVQ